MPLKPGTDTLDARNELGHSFCDGAHANVPNVPAGTYRLCIDEKHCTVVTVTSTPATQQVEIHVKP